MSVTGISRQLRSLLADSPGTPLAEVLLAVDSFVLECSSSIEQDALLRNLDDELQCVHHDLVDHSSLRQTEVFLAVLHHLRPVLAATSVISTWFDLILRPAIREPKLPTAAVNHAKELIICALEDVNGNQEKVGEFRRRLLDLYLHDAFNEGSGDDILEWADLNQHQKDKRAHWKSNLEDILVKYGLERPADFLTEINICFSTPSSRLQLLMFLNSYTSQQSFQTSASVLATHPLMPSLITSLLLDNSSTLCATGLTVLVKLLPIFAVHACEDLKGLLPQLLAILLRVICWKERPLRSSASSTFQLGDPSTTETDLDREFQDDKPLHARADLGWERLELTFDATASSAPCPRAFFTRLYYLFPRNTLRSLREPVIYLEESAVTSPYTVGWEKALDEVKIHTKCESLTRSHILHPWIIWRDTSSELSEDTFWASYDVSRIASESMMFDLRNATFGMRERHPELVLSPPMFNSMDEALQNTLDYGAGNVFAGDLSGAPTPHVYPVDLELTPGRPRISLQDMISTSVALKSNLDVEILRPSSPWPSSLFPTATSSPSKASLSLPPEKDSSSLLQLDNVDQDQSQNLPSNFVRAISGLQREVLLLRNELNFELWLSRENVRHIGRLYQDQVLSKNAEAERQGLYNKLRKYKAQVVGLERELREHKEQASSAKSKYADWNTELQNKLREFRAAKKSWIAESAALRSAEKEAQARFTAQEKLLAEATKELFELQTQKKETQHKIDRLRDYERQIEQHIKLQRLWDDDFKKFNARGQEIQLMKSQYRQMEMRLESYEKTQEKMEDSARGYRRQIQGLEARLAFANRKNETARQIPADEIAAFVEEKASLAKANDELREENADLMDEVEEMRAMLEMLKAQVSGKRGLISARASPIMFAS